MIKKFKQFVNENKQLPLRKYYSFDWDDNILKMPTKIIMIENKTGKKIQVSTEDFVEYRNNPNYSTFEDSYINFRDFGPKGKMSFIEDTIEALSNKNYAKSWDDFIECITNGSLFSIITTRGHNPETLKNGVEYIIKNHLDSEQYNELISNLISFKSFYNDFDPLEKVNDNRLISEYLNLCKFYPISNENIYKKYLTENEAKEGIYKHQEYLKIQCLQDFINHINDINKDKQTEIKFGFSDDDKKNIEDIHKHFGGEDNISIYHTKDDKIKM